MDGELFTDSEQDWSSSSESDWMSETGKRKGKQGVKRKMDQQNGKTKKIARTTNSRLPGVDLTDVFQEVRKKEQLAVHCGKIAGHLYRIKYDNGEKCILCKGKWFTPSMFEKFGGKGHHKKWKSSIYYKPSNGFQPFKLLELIQNGCLSEFGQMRESNREATPKRLFSRTPKTPVCGIEEETIQLDSSSDESVSAAERVKTVTQTESHKRLFSKTLEKPECRIEEETIQLDSSSDESVSVAVRVKKNRRESTANDRYSFSDESVSVAERVKMNRRESVTVTETLTEKITEPVESTASARDSPAPPTDDTEPAVSRQLRESIREVTQTESWKRLFSKSLEIPVCRIEQETFQLDRSSDESVSVAEKVKMADDTRGNFLSNVAKQLWEMLPSTGNQAQNSKKITERVKSTANARDSSVPLTDATEPAVSPVVEEADQTTDEAAAAAQLNFSDSPADATEPAVSPVVEEADQTTDEAAAQLNFSDSPTDATEPTVSPVVEEADQTTDEAAAQLNFSDSPTDATEPAVSPVVEEADQTTDEAAAALLNFSDSPTDATEHAVAPAVEEADQTTDEAAAAAQLNFSDSPTDATEPTVSPVVDEADQTTDEAAAQLNFSDSPTDATEPAVSPVVDEADQTTDEAAAAAQLNFSDSPTDATEPAVSPVVEEANPNTDEASAQLNFSDSPAEWQKPTASEETENMQLIKFLENQFKTINNTLKSIDLSLKKLVEKQSQDTPPQYIFLIPADFENPQINPLVKEEPVTEGGGSTEEAEL